MKTVLLLIIILAVNASESAFSDTANPANSESPQKKFCREVQAPGFFQQRSFDNTQRLSFENPAGPFNIGSCWWHAHLQRSALYLAVYRPELSAPTSAEQVKDIINQLAENQNVVEIPGYSDLFSFSRTWENAFLDYLAEWEASDLLLFQKWILAVLPQSMSFDRVHETMDELYDRVVGKNQIVFMAIRLPGSLDRIHGILVNQMTKTQNGYDIHYIDSNFPSSDMIWNYKFTDTSLPLTAVGSGVPYIQQNDELDTYPSLIENYCSSLY